MGSGETKLGTSEKKVLDLPEWWLSAVFELDTYAPGFGASALRASDTRKHLIASCLASGLKMIPEFERRRFASLLITAPETKVLDMMVRRLLPGCKRAFRKIHGGIHDREFYWLLLYVHRYPPHQGFLEALRHCGSITPGKLRTAALLPPSLCKADILENVPESALCRLPGLLREVCAMCDGDIDSSISEAGKRLACGGSVAAFLSSLMKNARLPPPPVPGDSLVHPLCTIRSMIDEARKFQNCLREMTTHVLTGEWYFYKCVFAGEEVIAQLARRRDCLHRWRLNGIFGKQNRAPSISTRSAAEAWFRERGIVNGDTSYSELVRMWQRSVRSR